MDTSSRHPIVPHQREAPGIDWVCLSSGSPCPGYTPDGDYDPDGAAHVLDQVRVALAEVVAEDVA